jgi:hypothetical protein
MQKGGSAKTSGNAPLVTVSLYCTQKQIRTMKKTITLLLVITAAIQAHSQKIYYDFDSTRTVYFKDWGSAKLDTNFTTPSTNTVNSSQKCGRYIRDTVWYDNFKMYAKAWLVNVAPYASSSTSAPKLTMKVMTNAPVNTKILMQLGVRSITSYPAGVHSEYVGFTTKRNEWETVTFNFSNLGGYSSSEYLDKIVVFFKPESAVRDTFYFDDIMGPETTLVSIPELTSARAGIIRTLPNPAGDRTLIRLEMQQDGAVSMDLFDVLGNRVMQIENGNLTAGNHDYNVDVSHLNQGVYFCNVRSGPWSRTMRLVVAR